MTLEPREHTPLWLVVLAPVAAVAASLILCSVLILWTGQPVLKAYALLLGCAFGSSFGIAETLTRSTPLILTGLAVAVAFRAKFWNIGAEGQAYGFALAHEQAVPCEDEVVALLLDAQAELRAIDSRMLREEEREAARARREAEAVPTIPTMWEEAWALTPYATETLPERLLSKGIVPWRAPRRALGPCAATSSWPHSSKSSSAYLRIIL